MALNPKFTTNFLQKRRITHFLTIPLVTPTSRPQFRDSIRCLWDDLAAIGVPTDAIRPLSLLHLSLETPLSLTTPAHIDKAKEVLEKFFMKDSLTSGNLSRHSSSALPTSSYDTHNSMASPSVSISSLFYNPDKAAKAFGLSTIVYDPTHRIRNWVLRLRPTCQAAGLSPKPDYHYDLQVRAAIAKRVGSYDATVRLLSMPSSTKVVPCKWDPGKLMKVTQSFDARGLLERYKEHIWIENAPLERVSICKLGFHGRGLEELPEVFSVPLS